MIMVHICTALPLRQSCFWLRVHAQKDAGNKKVHGLRDVLDDVTAGLNPDANALKASVEKYNDYCEKDMDEDFSKSVECLSPLERGSYYAFELMTDSIAFAGGMKINTEMQILNENKQPPPHLYAVGNNRRRSVR